MGVNKGEGGALIENSRGGPSLRGGGPFIRGPETGGVWQTSPASIS